MRTASGLTWMASARQNTAGITIDNTTQAVSQQWTDPYGNVRGSSGAAWPAADTRGFVGGTPRADGLTTLGARAYDALLGRFTSVDPLRSDEQPQRFDGYAYCADNPVGMSDPSGLSPSPPRDPDPDQYEGQWWFETGSWRNLPDQDGYHQQFFDGLYFSCRDQGRQCWGFGSYWSFDQNKVLYIGPNGSSKTTPGPTWIDMTGINVRAHEYPAGALIYVYSDPYSTIIRTPICNLNNCYGGTGGGGGGGGGSGGGGGGSGSGSGGPGAAPPTATNHPECPCQQTPYIPPPTISPACGNGFLGVLCNAWGEVTNAVNLFGGPENILKYAFGIGCIMATEGLGALLCGTVSSIVIGTAFNVFDTAMAGGIAGPNPDTNFDNLANFAVNEGDTVASAFLPNDPGLQAIDMLLDGPQSPLDGIVASLVPTY